MGPAGGRRNHPIELLLLNSSHSVACVLGGTSMGRAKPLYTAVVRLPGALIPIRVYYLSWPVGNKILSSIMINQSGGPEVTPQLSQYKLT